VQTKATNFGRRWGVGCLACDGEEIVGVGGRDEVACEVGFEVNEIGHSKGGPGLAIAFARANRLPIAIRGGGHNPAGASSSISPGI